MHTILRQHCYRAIPGTPEGTDAKLTVQLVDNIGGKEVLTAVRDVEQSYRFDQLQEMAFGIGRAPGDHLQTASVSRSAGHAPLT